MIEILLYLIGVAIFYPIYMIYSAITAHYYFNFLGSEIAFYCVKIFEALFYIWFIHQVLKRHIFLKMPLGEAFVESFKMLKSFFGRLGKRTKPSKL
ncbi:hypothetical protein D1BOALGB6SA_3472 [Olavius sp. associated proteobacterium Delta 1]|nr:hypothetical protein D1BOALGB6SA_3472 [Olavius sp. associated proteobacterium Delta 1]